MGREDSLAAWANPLSQEVKQDKVVGFRRQLHPVNVVICKCQHNIGVKNAIRFGILQCY